MISIEILHIKIIVETHNSIVEKKTHLEHDIFNNF